MKYRTAILFLILAILTIIYFGYFKEKRVDYIPQVEKSTTADTKDIRQELLKCYNDDEIEVPCKG